MEPTLQNVFDAARGYLTDPYEQWFPNSALQLPFNEAYRRMWNCLATETARVERTVYITLPTLTTVIIPSVYGMNDFSEPEVLEERQANQSITIVGTTATSPISVNAPGHGLATGAEVVIGQVLGTNAPWGQWFIVVVDANNFTLNGSATDGVVGTGGIATVSSVLQFYPMEPVDFAAAGLDGEPTQYLGIYVWQNEQILLRGCTENQQIRITYQSSGTPPTNPNQVIGIDNCIDFLACATAANAARAKTWFQLADQLKFTAYGSTQEANGSGGLLGDFILIQVKMLQRTQRRRLPFRNKISRWGNYVLN